MNACKHSADGFCKACSEKKPYTQFRMCKDKCLKCNGCGYFWGPGAPEHLIDKPMYASGDKKEEP